MTNNNPLYEIKQQLFNSLGEEKEKKYLHFLRQWLLGKITCEQFHGEASNITTGNQVSLNNKFIALILNSGFSGRSTLFKSNPNEKYDKSSYQSNSGGNGTKRKRGSSKSESYKAYVDWQDHNEFSLPALSQHLADSQMIRHSAEELVLPDVEMVNGRFHVTAWDNKLTGVDHQIAEIVLQAVQIYLKNIITAIITKSRGFKTRDKFQYEFGVEVPNPWLRNTLLIGNDWKKEDISKPEVCGIHIRHGYKPILPEVENEKIYSISCGSGPKTTKNFNGVITLQLMYHTLKYNEKVFGNHQIFSSHMEQIVNALRHVN